MSGAFNSRRLGDPNAKEDKNTTVLAHHDLLRIREMCGINGARPEEEIEAEERANERRTLMEKSRSRVKNWPNTIENLRNRRIEDKYRKLEEAEVGNSLVIKVFIDREEKS